MGMRTKGKRTIGSHRASMVSMLRKTNNISKKKKTLKKIKKWVRHMARGSNNQHLKGIHAIGSEIIDATDGRTTDDGRRTKTPHQK